MQIPHLERVRDTNVYDMNSWLGLRLHVYVNTTSME